MRKCFKYRKYGELNVNNCKPNPLLNLRGQNKNKLLLLLLLCIT